MAKSSSLKAIEEEHGFVFGDPDDTAKAGRKGKQRVAILQCNNPHCDDRTQIEVFEDTVLPVHCGQCFNLMLADPDAGPDASLHVSGLDMADPDQMLDEVADRVYKRILAGQNNPPEQ